jgi:hypothetical protein
MQSTSTPPVVRQTNEQVIGRINIWGERSVPIGEKPDVTASHTLRFLHTLWQSPGHIFSHDVFCFTSSINRDGSVRRATGYGLDGPGSIPGSRRLFCLLRSVQTGSGAHTASYPVSTGLCLPGGNAAEA